MTPIFRDDDTRGSEPASTGRGGSPHLRLVDDEHSWHSTKISRASDDPPHVMDYVRIVVRHRILAISVFLSCLAVAAAYVVLHTPEYEARARVLIEPRTPRVVKFDEVVDDSATERDVYQTQFQLLRARSLARQTIESMGLWSHPVLNGSSESVLTHVLAGGREVVRSLGQLLGMGGDSELTPVENTRAHDAAVIDRFLGAVTVEPVQTSRLIDVSFRSQDPRFAAHAVNGLVRAYIAQNQNQRSSTTQGAGAWLDVQLAENRKRVDTAARNLQTYRERYGTVPAGEGTNMTLQRLGDLTRSLTSARAERLRKEALYRDAVAIGTDGLDVGVLPVIRNDPTVQQLRLALIEEQRKRAELGRALGERNAAMVKSASAIQSMESSLTSAVGAVVSSLRADYETALAQENALAAAVEQQRVAVQALDRLTINDTALDWELQSTREVYTSLLQRAQEMSVAGELRATNVRLVDAADVPRGPTGIGRSQILAIALLLGSTLSLGAVFTREYLDRRLKTANEVEQYLHVTALGLIPWLRRRQTTHPLLISDAMPAPFVEAFRGIRTNVTLSTGKTLKSVVVTSSQSGEGKTMVASNVALGFAQAGQRVVLVDADLRRPNVHNLMELPCEPGLSDTLLSQAVSADVLRQTSIPNLTVMTAGSRVSNPAELLGGGAFAKLLTLLEQQFDIVVVDSPPVLAVTDATLLADQVGTVLFVVAADMTNRDAAQTAVNQLVRGHGRLIGAILNRVDLERHATYHGVHDRKAYLERVASTTS